MKKLFVIIDTDDFLSATNQGGEMDNGLTAAFIRGFNFCEQNKPKEETRRYIHITAHEVYNAICIGYKMANMVPFHKMDDAAKQTYQLMADILNGQEK